MHPNLMNLFKALKDPNYVPHKQALGLAAQLPKKLLKWFSIFLHVLGLGSGSARVWRAFDI
jgi:hypothetical protein